MSGGRKNKEKGIGGNESEVEELLRASEDQLLLNLRVDSHTKSRSTTSSSYLDADLARRFDALKSPQSKSLEQPKGGGGVGGGGGGGDDVDLELNRVLGDDLSARFAALKRSSAFDRGLQKSDRVSALVDEDDSGDRDGDGVSKEEVEKVMQWAMDAARLDPSKSDDDNDDDDALDDDDDDLQEEEVREERDKGKGKSKKWFFF